MIKSSGKLYFDHILYSMQDCSHACKQISAHTTSDSAVLKMNYKPLWEILTYCTKYKQLLTLFLRVHYNFINGSEYNTVYICDCLSCQIIFLAIDLLSKDWCHCLNHFGIHSPLDDQLLALLLKVLTESKLWCKF